MSNNNNNEIDRDELESLLRPRYGPKCRVLEAETSDFLPPGENFACTLYKVEARAKRSEHEDDDDDNAVQRLSLVAKTFPSSEAVLKIFDFNCLFEKEIFFYDRLAPALRRIELRYRADATEDDAFDIVPKLYGFRKSRKANEDDDKVDDGVLLLMENLKAKGYYTMNKVKGLDLAHSRQAILHLARMHALAVALKHHEPDFFAGEVVKHAIVAPFHEPEDREDLYEVMRRLLMLDERNAPYADQIAKLLGAEYKVGFFLYQAPEPWCSIMHFDFWTNNVLYHRDEATGRIDDCKFIDFQNYVYNSPLRDLPYFLCSSTEARVMRDHLDELLDLYYETFCRVLKSVQYPKPEAVFTRRSFDEQLKIDAKLEFFHNVLAIKFFCAEIDASFEPGQIDAVIIDSGVNKTGYDKWHNIVQTYLRKDWL
ncbi:hypothetical protein TKK_0012673 [Trichogramma kaykai]|uniref:CHK kinase-like domain-containing protein n=1 Tax=Trichogramma kaykai TaxID=54128 RepID=A0ABD2WM16_9HYME